VGRDIAPAPRREISVLAPQAVVLERGAELGVSTWVLRDPVVSSRSRAMAAEVKAGLSVRLGQSLGTLH